MKSLKRLQSNSKPVMLIIFVIISEYSYFVAEPENTQRCIPIFKIHQY